jgi:hypothetical protein
VPDDEMAPELSAVMWHHRGNALPSNGLGRHCSAPIFAVGRRTAYPTGGRQGWTESRRNLVQEQKTYPLSLSSINTSNGQTSLDKSGNKGNETS